MTSAESIERFRSLRRELERSVLPLATSLAGKLFSHPAFARFGRRVSAEGGGDVPADWA